MTPLFLLLVLATSHAFVAPRRTRVNLAFFSTATPAPAAPFSDSLSSVLKKASKTLAVVIDVDMQGSREIGTRSMQLRKLKASALASSSVEVARQLVQEQASAQGNFPGPAPVIYTGSEYMAAVEAGVSAVVVDAGVDGSSLDANVIYRVQSVEDINRCQRGAYLVDASIEQVAQILAAIPAGSIVLASTSSMLPENAELSVKAFKELGMTAVLVEKAVVGDNEDLEYVEFIVDGLTKKKSSTFNMSGLTGSTNGHFGGVASSRPRTWLRVKRQQ